MFEKKTINACLPQTYSRPLQSMIVVISAATSGELMPTYLAINPLYTNDNAQMKVLFHLSGAGMLQTAVSLTRMSLKIEPDFIIQVGIAGAFNTSLPLGKTVVVNEEMLGDMGVQEDNKWNDIFDLKLTDSSFPPFEKRKLVNPHLLKYNLLKLPEVSAVTVNEISTDVLRIRQLIKKYNPVIESMEGAALHYVCTELNIPFIQIRSISNYIGDRNKNDWKLKEAIKNINQTLLKYVDKLYNLPINELIARK
jgi:futalosine hydrolase